MSTTTAIQNLIAAATTMQQVRADNVAAREQALTTGTCTYPDVPAAEIALSLAQRAAREDAQAMDDTEWAALLLQVREVGMVAWRAVRSARS